MDTWLGESVPKLGFGMMRLPMDGNKIDIAQTAQMVDSFMQAGFTYFDTAYGYLEEQSEPAVYQTVVSRYPRDQFLLATKLPLWHIKEAGDPQRLFETQLSRTQAGYFDYYMLHALSASALSKLDELDVWAFMRRKKAEGLVRHIGFSFHDSAAVLDDVLIKHPEMEFVQLQINYADWENNDVQSRLCYETARKHGKSVIIMEPVKGGALAAMPQQARDVFTAVHPDWSTASWAMRFAAALPGVITVLSGMSDMAQMVDNIHTLQHFAPLTAQETQAIEAVQAILDTIPTTPCTNCKYCIENGGCPQDIPIPGIIDIDNGRRLYDRVDKGAYAFTTKGHGKASDCIQCGNCESRCPQHIKIISLLEACVNMYES